MNFTIKIKQHRFLVISLQVDEIPPSKELAMWLHIIAALKACDVDDLKLEIQVNQ